MLKSRSDEAPVRRRSLVERTGMKNLMQVTIFLLLSLINIFLTMISISAMLMTIFMMMFFLMMLDIEMMAVIIIQAGGIMEIKMIIDEDDDNVVEDDDDADV